jgi:histidinol dehydrogenase
MKIVKEILNDVKKNGDNAVLKYNKKFDNNKNKKFKVSKTQIKSAYEKVDKETLKQLKFAAKNIEFFAKKQKSQLKDFKLKTNFGIIGQKIIPINKVACYVPGGNYPLPSTALMTVIPAKVAGVKEIIVFSPKITNEVIVAADIAGANKIFNVGGVQSIAACTFGTKQIPKVDKIVGPANKYVTSAKKEVFGEVGIDFIAGPSEVLIIADKFSNPKLIAADLLAQAEHDTNARANLITTSKKIKIEVKKEIKKQLSELRTKDIAKVSIDKSFIKVVKNINDAIIISNKIAPEHLELQIKNYSKYINKFNNYGSLFIGEKSAEVFGDYCTGPNHTLPTMGASKYTGGLSVIDFVKITTFQEVKKTNKKIIDCSSKLAEIEGLFAHKNSSFLRKKET